MRPAVLTCLLVGCGFSHGSLPGTVTDGGPGMDERLIDMRMIDGCTTFSTQVDTCSVGADIVKEPFVLTGDNSYHTGTQVLTLDGGTTRSLDPIAETVNGINVVFVESLTMQFGATLRVTGPNPLGIVATGSIEIAGLIDLRGDTQGGGAGARSDTDCGNAAGKAGEADDGGGGGGGGGAFAGDGGAGANGDSDDNNDEGGISTGGAAGTKIARPSTITGGCDGGAGGEADGNGGNGGNGGGALFLASATSVVIGGTGVINAGGSGGRGGVGNGGGGGGGASGGMILIETGTFSFTGKLAANGGGGGEGADGTNGNPGETGRDTTTRAVGGSGAASEGGDAEDGGAGSTPNGVTATQSKKGGGGGGGGGAGFIAIGPAAIPLTGSISPTAAAWP